MKADDLKEGGGEMKDPEGRLSILKSGRRVGVRAQSRPASFINAGTGTIAGVDYLFPDTDSLRKFICLLEDALFSWEDQVW